MFIINFLNAITPYIALTMIIKAVLFITKYTLNLNILKNTKWAKPETQRHIIVQLALLTGLIGISFLGNHYAGGYWLIFNAYYIYQTNHDMVYAIHHEFKNRKN